MSSENPSSVSYDDLFDRADAVFDHGAYDDVPNLGRSIAIDLCRIFLSELSTTQRQSFDSACDRLDGKIAFENLQTQIKAHARTLMSHPEPKSDAINRLTYMALSNEKGLDWQEGQFAVQMSEAASVPARVVWQIFTKHVPDFANA